MTTRLKCAETATTTYRPKCATVLIVEDDPDIRDALQQALEIEGYNVVAAVNGAVGLEKLAVVQRPCLVLLDLMMPVMNGLEFLKELHQDDALAAIPVLMVTAYGKLAAEAQGTVGLVKKPIDLDVLLDFVKKYCG
jgi:CheY-like chemotaxis protein